MYRRDTYKFYNVTYVRSCCRINTVFTEYRETSLVWCRIVTRAYRTRDNTTCDLSLYSVNNIYVLYVCVHRQVHVHVYVCVRMCVCVYVRVCVCMCMCTCILSVTNLDTWTTSNLSCIFREILSLTCTYVCDALTISHQCLQKIVAPSTHRNNNGSTVRVISTPTGKY